MGVRESCLRNQVFPTDPLSYRHDVCDPSVIGVGSTVRMLDRPHQSVLLRRPVTPVESIGRFGVSKDMILISRDFHGVIDCGRPSQDLLHGGVCPSQVSRLVSIL